MFKKLATQKWAKQQQIDGQFKKILNVSEYCSNSYNSFYLSTKLKRRDTVKQTLGSTKESKGRMRKGGKFMMEVEDHMTEDKNVIVKLYLVESFFSFFLFQVVHGDSQIRNRKRAFPKVSTERKASKELFLKILRNLL